MIWRLKFWFGFACLMFFLLTLSITITINSTWLYQLNIIYGNFLPLVNLNAQQMLHNFNQLMEYLNYPWIVKLQMSNFTDSPSGLEHFREVKRLFLINYIVLISTTIPAFVFLYRIWKSKTEWRLIQPLQVIFAAIFVLITMMFLGFNQFFISFHKILFRNNDWEFYPIQDPIINGLPESYFNQSFILFFILLVIFLGILYFWGQRFFKVKYQKNKHLK